MRIFTWHFSTQVDAEGIVEEKVKLFGKQEQAKALCLKIIDFSVHIK